MFSKMFKSESLNKDDILFTLLPFMKDDNHTKLQFFINYFKSDKIEYEKFINIFNDYIQFNLVTFQEIFLLESINLVEEEVKDELKRFSKELYNEKNIDIYKKSVLSDWEHLYYHSLDDFTNLQGIFISKQDIESILKHHEYMFDFWALKKMFARCIFNNLKSDVITTADNEIGI